MSERRYNGLTFSERQELTEMKKRVAKAMSNPSISIRKELDRLFRNRNLDVCECSPNNAEYLKLEFFI